MKPAFLIAFLIPFLSLSQPKGKADELYEKYDPKPYVNGFSFGRSLLRALPLDFEMSPGEDLVQTLNGEISRIQWLIVNDDRYLNDVTKDWERFLSRTGYNKIMIDNDGTDSYIYTRGSKKHFDEAHFLISEKGFTMLLTAYGDFSLNKKLDENR